jgi:glycosyltransferase involved in cell wall biosynthesis
MNLKSITPQTGLVTVIIPCFNAKETLVETVASVERQTYPDWEIIIVNDGSSDGSDRLADKLAESKRITVVHTANKGVSHARNTGVENAAGEYLAFLDADDSWHPEKLQAQVEYFKKHDDCGVCFSKVRFTSPTGKSLNQYSYVPKQPLSAFGLLVENHLCTSSNIMCRKQAFQETGGFEIGMNYAEDQEWLLRMALQDRWKINGIPQVLVDYRTQNGSLSSSLDKMEQGWLMLVNKVKRYAPEFINRHFLQAQAVYLRYLARRSLRQGEPAHVGLTYIKRAIQSDWTILLASPWRTLATLTGLIGWWFISLDYSTHFFRISKKAG